MRKFEVVTAGDWEFDRHEYKHEQRHQPPRKPPEKDEYGQPISHQLKADPHIDKALQKDLTKRNIKKK